MTTIQSRYVDVDLDLGGATMTTYLAEPAGGGPSPSVLVCPEIFGFTPHVRDAAERLARAGYVALIADFNHRATQRTELAYDDAGRTQGLALLRQLSRETVLADLAAVIAHLRQRSDATGKVGVLGFSSGGHIAYLAATASDISSAIALYPGWVANTGIPLSTPEPTVALTPGIARHGARLLYIVGGADHLIPAEENRAIEAALTAAGVAHEMVVYPGVGHGFLFDGRAAYDAASADDAWQRIMNFLAATLR